MINRRDAMKRIGTMAGAAAMAKYLPGCGDNTTGGITTYVFMMLENRSYDHYFGARSMLEGKPGDGLQMSFVNNDLSDNPIAPWQPTVDQMCTPDPPHGWRTLHESWGQGKCDGFVRQHQIEHKSTTLTDPMQFLTRTQLPISYALADAYTTCDRWFCSVMGPTLPNRAYWHAATSFGIGPHDNANDEILTAFSSVPVPTIYHRLRDRGVDWAYYYGSIAVLALLGNPGPYQLDLGLPVTGNVRPFGDYQGTTGQFFKDAAAGTLPPVTYIDPFFYLNDDHPPIHPIHGQMLIAAVYRALATSPQWNNCMLVVTYDENGGFYDHVSPPTTEDDSLAKYGVAGFEQMGFRVPTLVAGPYVKPGYVSSVTYDHTSALKQLQNAFGLEPLNVRMDAANDLLDCIDLDALAAAKPRAPIDLPVINVDDWPMDPSCFHAGGFRALDPISLWTDANKDSGRFGKLFDLRDGRQEYLRSIRRFLSSQQGNVYKMGT